MPLWARMSQGLEPPARSSPGTPIRGVSSPDAPSARVQSPKTWARAQVELSGVTNTSISLPFITATAEGPKHIDTTITRAQFEKMCSDLLDRCAPLPSPRGEVQRGRKADLQSQAGSRSRAG